MSLFKLTEEGLWEFLIFGSYALNGNAAFESDIDVICWVLPKITKAMFFTNLFDILVKDERISKWVPIRWAKVPIITLECEGVSFYLSFAQIKREYLKNLKEELENEKVIDKFSAAARDTMSGYTSTQKILQMVPWEEKFSFVLRVIKTWARKRSVTSSKIGFPNGVSWAILVAKICIDNNELTKYELIHTFFKHYNEQDWSETIKIFEFLPENEEEKEEESAGFHKIHLCIQNPAYPYQNIWKKTIKTNIFWLKFELKRAVDILDSKKIV